MGKKVLVGFSGGVDSAVAAFLLKEQGFDVTAMTLDLTGELPTCQERMKETIADAREAAERIGIKHIVSSDYRELFTDVVINSFVGEYLRGRTPNPCVVCNPRVKFRALFSTAKKLGCDVVATGHYARCGYDYRYGTTLIRRAVSQARDQSYMLYRLPVDMRERIVFPLGGFEKEQVRNIAKKNDLRVAKKRDSQDNCFIPDNNHAAFIEEYTKTSAIPGNFVDRDGNVLGRHQGIIRYTVGQRKGLGIAFGERKFVTSISANDNTVTLGSNEELLFDSIEISEVYAAVKFKVGQRVMCKVRSAAPIVPCTIEPSRLGARIVFETPVRAPAKGQAAVIYDEDGTLLGGGIIE